MYKVTDCRLWRDQSSHWQETKDSKETNERLELRQILGFFGPLDFSEILS
jgi:hypothetical protein